MRLTYAHHPHDEHGLQHWFSMSEDLGYRQGGFTEISAWCYDRFGERGMIRYATDANPTVRWQSSSSYGRFYLRDDDDAFEFRMRWG